MAEPTDDLPTNDSDFINTAKLATLPKWLQEGLPTLDKLQLKRLGAVISRHFEFLSLPLELRANIYEMIFCAEKRSPIVQFAVHHCPTSSLDTSILSTCKQIREEARNVLGRVRTVKLYATAFPDGSQRTSLYSNASHFRDSADDGVEHCLSPQVMGALIHFRKVEIDVTLFSSMLLFDYGQAPKWTVGSILFNWVQLLKQQLADVDLNVANEISLTFNLDGDPMLRQQLWSGFPHPKRVGHMPVPLYFGRYLDPNEPLWHRVHLAEMVKSMREDLLQQGLGSKVIVSSNVDSDLKTELPHLEIVRQSSKRIRFHDARTGMKGAMVLRIGRPEDLGFGLYSSPFSAMDVELKFDE
ncbi:hypothetical protein E2P81_ATG04555 [Venturia nashicola]|nr:hypothetical protein E2P81_ATG04555 [Venturia nashicola]